MLTDKLVSGYTKIMEALAWILLIAGTVLGAMIGYAIDEDIVFIGLIIGLVSTFILEAVTFPPLIVLFKIYDSVSGNTKGETSESKKETKIDNGSKQAENNEDAKKDINETKLRILEGGVWVCPMCSAHNAANDKRCYCGYKRED